MKKDLIGYLCLFLFVTTFSGCVATEGNVGNVQGYASPQAGEATTTRLEKKAAMKGEEEARKAEARMDRILALVPR